MCVVCFSSCLRLHDFPNFLLRNAERFQPNSVARTRPQPVNRDDRVRRLRDVFYRSEITRKSRNRNSHIERVGFSRFSAHFVFVTGQPLRLKVRARPMGGGPRGLSFPPKRFKRIDTYPRIFSSNLFHSVSI